MTASAVLTAPAANADPAGTKPLYAGLTERPMVRVLDASTAGVLYRTAHPDPGGAGPTYVKPTGGSPVRVPAAFTHLAGSMLFTDPGVGGRITYRTIGDATAHSCVSADGATTVFLPNGWLYAEPAWPNTVFKRVTATASGCTTKTLTTITSASLLAADLTGFAVSTSSNSGVQTLEFVAFAAPSVVRTLATQDGLYGAVSVGAGAVTWADAVTNTQYTLKWVRTSGGTVRSVPTDYVIRRTAATAGASAFYGCLDLRELAHCVAGTVPAAGGSATVVVDVTGLAGDGAAFYFGMYGTRSTLDKATSASGPFTRLVTRWCTTLAPVPAPRLLAATT